MESADLTAFLEELNRDIDRRLDATHRQHYHAWLFAHTGDREIFSKGRLTHRLVVWLQQLETRQLSVEMSLLRAEVGWWHGRMVRSQAAQCADLVSENPSKHTRSKDENSN